MTTWVILEGVLIVAWLLTLQLDLAVQGFLYLLMGSMLPIVVRVVHGKLRRIKADVCLSSGDLLNFTPEQLSRLRASSGASPDSSPSQTARDSTSHGESLATVKETEMTTFDHTEKTGLLVNTTKRHHRTRTRHHRTYSHTSHHTHTSMTWPLATPWWCSLMCTLAGHRHTQGEPKA